MTSATTANAPRARRRGLTHRLLSGNLREGELGLLLLAPALAFIGFVAIYPILDLLWTSLHFNVLTQPWRGTPFVGLRNYGDALDDPRFWQTSWTTLILVVTSVAGSFVVGLPLALLANVPTAWRWLVRVALLLPWAMPLAIGSLIWRWMFNSTYGVFNDLLQRLGFEPVLWLVQPDTAMLAVIVTTIWKTSSFVGLVLLAGLQSIPRELYEAAAVDGSTRWSSFWRVTLPLLRPAIAVALVFRTLTAIQSFDIPYALTGGGPGTSTQTLGMYVHLNLLDFLDFGYGAALAGILFLFSLIATTLYLRYLSGDPE